MLGNLVNNLGKLFGGQSPQAAPDQGQENPAEAVSQSENLEHSQAGKDLAQAPQQDPAEFIKNTAPTSEEEFTTFPVAKFFSKLQSLVAGSKVAEFLEFGVDLAKVSTFETFNSILGKIKSKLSQNKNSQAEEEELGNAFMQMLMGGAPGAGAAEKPAVNNSNGKDQAAELQNLEQELSNLEGLLKGLGPAEESGDSKAKKKPEEKASKDSPKVSLAKKEASAKQNVKELDALLSQLTAA